MSEENAGARMRDRSAHLERVVGAGGSAGSLGWDRMSSSAGEGTGFGTASPSRHPAAISAVTERARIPSRLRE
jgi:hypothetical protein